MNDIIYEPTEQEHRLAYYKHVLEFIFYEILIYFQDEEMYPPSSLDKLIARRECYLKKFKEWFAHWGDKHGNDDVWESVIDYEEFKAEHLKRFSEIHDGYCTGHDYQCDRCKSEEVYGVASTAPPKRIVDSN
jgi:hypothetical protein